MKLGDEFFLNLLNTVFAMLLLNGCGSKPDESRSVNGPNNGVIYVIETFYGHGPVSADNTNVYAVPREGDGERRLVLAGENLEIKKLEWKNATNLLICLTGGITSHYSNLVTVQLGRGSINIRNHLVEEC
jgi:hypothetical protein